MAEKTKHKIIGYDEFSKDVLKIYENGISRGMDTGFKTLDTHYSFKLGGTTYIMASPTAGKTEFTFELLLNLTAKYECNHVIFSPETGGANEIFAELISKFCRKQFYRNYANHISEKELHQATAALKQHFLIIDPTENDITIEEMYEMVDKYEAENHIKIHTTLADPFNEFTHNFGGDNGRQDLYIERILGLVRRNARQKERHNIIATHAAAQQLQKDENTGIWYYPAPTVRNYAGGEAWYRKGLGMISMWRPPVGLSNDAGKPYQEDEVVITIQKAKPKGIGRTGKVSLYFDSKCNRYYEYDDNGAFNYAYNTDYEGKPLIRNYGNDIFKQVAKERDDEKPPF